MVEYFVNFEGKKKNMILVTNSVYFLGTKFAAKPWQRQQQDLVFLFLAAKGCFANVSRIPKFNRVCSTKSIYRPESFSMN